MLTVANVGARVNRKDVAQWFNRTRHGELDLIATQGGQVVFVEVRSRSTATGGTAEESIGPDKQRRLRRMASQYLQQHEDVVLLQSPRARRSA